MKCFFGGGSGLLWYVYVTYTRCLVSCCFRSLWWQALDIAGAGIYCIRGYLLCCGTALCVPVCVTRFWENLSSCSRFPWPDLQRYRLSLYSWTLQINTCFGFKSSVALTYTCVTSQWGIMLLFAEQYSWFVISCFAILNASFKGVLYSWGSHWLCVEVEVLEVCWFDSYSMKWQTNRRCALILNS